MKRPTPTNYGFFLDLLGYRVPENDPAYLPPLRDPRQASKVIAFAANAELAPLTDPSFDWVGGLAQSLLENGELTGQLVECLIGSRPRPVCRISTAYRGVQRSC
jgi:hypothetical protein